MNATHAHSNNGEIQKSIISHSFRLLSLHFAKRVVILKEREFSIMMNATPLNTPVQAITTQRHPATILDISDIHFSSIEEES